MKKEPLGRSGPRIVALASRLERNERHLFQSAGDFSSDTRRLAHSRPLHAREAPFQGAAMFSGLIALAFAAAFAGAAVYVNIVEQPARLALDDQALLSEWGPSDRRGVALLAAFALAAAVAGFAAYFEIAGRALGFRGADHHIELALRLFRHGAAQQSDSVAARQ